MYSNHIFPITDLPRGLGLNFFSLVKAKCNYENIFWIGKYSKGLRDIHLTFRNASFFSFQSSPKRTNYSNIQQSNQIINYTNL